MKKAQEEFGWRFVVIVASAVLAAWGGSWALIDWLISEDSARGAFGDKFGAVNALFSGLAFAGLIVTLLFQKRELKLQREELSYTREELAGQREELQKQGEAFIEQNKAINQQRFENTFFNLLKTHQEIVKNLPQGPDAYRQDKIHFFESAYIYYGKHHITRSCKKPHINTDESREQAIAIAVRELHNKIESPITWNYYALLYRIIKFVDECDYLHSSEKYDYICILRAQLSYYELWGLFYHCLNERACSKFKPLVEKYALFNNLDVQILNFPEDKDKYEASAYNYTHTSN